MSAEPCGIDLVKEVIVILGKHPIRLYNELFARRIHLNLRLFPIRLGDRKFGALVGLDLVDHIVLAVEVNTESHLILANSLYPYLTVTPLDAEVIEDAMLVCRTCGGVLIGEVILGQAELYVPPFGEGVGLPMSHDGCRIGSTEPPCP